MQNKLHLCNKINFSQTSIKYRLENVFTIHICTTLLRQKVIDNRNIHIFENILIQLIKSLCAEQNADDAVTAHNNTGRNV